MSKFNNIPEQKDNEIIFRAETRFGDFDVVYEKWEWDGILAESIIFDEDDVSEMDDDEIINQEKDSPLFDDKIYKRRSNNKAHYMRLIFGGNFRCIYLVLN